MKGNWAACGGGTAPCEQPGEGTLRGAGIQSGQLELWVHSCLYHTPSATHCPHEGIECSVLHPLASSMAGRTLEK